MKVITFSRVFPAYHPKKGQPTYFVEKIWKSFGINPHFPSPSLSIHNQSLPYSLIKSVGETLDCPNFFNPKHHTIRAGNRWKVGDKFSPRVWSGKPYQSKQIIIAPDIEVKKVWDLKVSNKGFFINGNFCNVDIMDSIIKNDGLSVDDFYDWFEKHIKDSKESNLQIICWNNEVDYISLWNISEQT